jgi:predicted RNase H-like nuclease (RuvC/YqgF family)
MDIIAAKEAVDKTELSLKGQLRTLQNENQDLRFVVDQKDIKTAKLNRQIAGLKAKLDESLQKLYHPFQDEVIQGLNLVKDQEHNIIKGG